MTDRVYARRAWGRVRQVVLARDGWACQVRGPLCTGRAEQVDHVVPWRQGGAWYELSNLRAVCAKCNGQLVHMGVTGRAPSREWL